MICKGMWRTRRFTAALGAAVALLAVPPAILAQESYPTPADGPWREVHDIDFVGAKVFSHDELRSAIITSATECRSVALRPVCWFGGALDRRYLDENTLRADLVRLQIFYYERGYRQTVVEADTVRVPVNGSSGPGALRVVLRVDEGDPVRVSGIDLAGEASLLPDGTDADLPLRVGEPLSYLAYEASRDSLESMLRNRGFAHARVLASYDIPEDSPLSEVEFEILPGPSSRFGAIEVSGAERVSPSVVRRLLTFRSGDLYRQEDLLRSQQNLFSLAIFRHAEIQTVLDNPADSVIPVVVQVSEGDVHRVRLGVGLSTAECINAEGRWISRNFLGGARRLELRGQISNVLADPVGGTFPCIDTGTGIYNQLSGALGADFSQPWFFGPLNTFRTGIFAERRSLPDVFVRTSQGAYVSVERQISQRTSVAVGFGPELTRLQADGDLFFCVNFVACAEQDIRVLQDPHWLTPLTLSFGRDRSNSPFNPTSGHILLIEAEHGARGLGSDFAYTRVSGDISAYGEVARDVVLAGRLSAGWARSLDEPVTGELGLHPQKRFFAGGPNSVRGYAQHRLGPKVLTVSAAEQLAQPRDAGGAGCSSDEINAGTCDANPIDPHDFDVRPVGGSQLLEGSLELRFPVYAERVAGAVFVDVGQIWSSSGDVSLADLAWTPGAGLRYLSPVGPIRLDLGYNPQGAEALTAITTRVSENESTSELVPLAIPVFWNPRTSFWNRLQLHISIGQAF